MKKTNGAGCATGAGGIRMGAARRAGAGRGAAGFTLLEVMIVIVIILAIATLVGVNLMGTKAEATKGTVQLQMVHFKDGLKRFFVDLDRYPTDEEGVAVLWDKSKLAEDDQAKWKGPYLEEPKPTDTWGSPWGYRQVGEKAPSGMFDLWSYGPDKQDGTDDDINLWKQTADPADSGRGTPSTGGNSRPSGGGNSGGGGSRPSGG